MTRNIQTRKLYISKGSEAGTFGAAFGMTANHKDLFAVLEGIEGSEGVRPMVKRIKISLRVLASVTQDPFAFRPIVVQTAGTWADNNNATPTLISTMLNVDIDDDFSYEPVTPWKVSRMNPTPQQALGFAFEVPAKIIALINKEIASERLQDLFLGWIAVGTNTQTLTTTSYLEVEYTEVRRNITIR